MANLPVLELPSDLEAEQAVLGAILIDPLTLYATSIRARDFYSERHAWIFEGFQALSNANKPIDFVTLVAWLQDNRRDVSVGYVTSLLSATPSAFNIEAYADRVIRMARRRELIAASGVIAGMAYGSKDMDIPDMVAKARQEIDNVDTNGHFGEGKMLSDAVAEFVVDLEEYYDNKRETWGTPTKLDLDRETGGLQPGDFIVIASDPGRGKTALLNKILLNVALQNIHCVYFSIEMTVKKLMMRLAADLSGVDSKLIKQGKINEAQKDAIMTAMDRIHTAPLMFFEKPISTVGVRAELMKLSHTFDPRVVGIDYSMLMTDKEETEMLRVMRISRGCKNIAKEMNVSLLLVHPITRSAGHDKRVPKLIDLGWSRQMEYDPDLVLFPYFSDERVDKKAVIQIGKSRDGIADIPVPMIFDGIRWANPAY